MKRVAEELLILAKELAVDLSLTFKRESDSDSSTYNNVHFEIQRMADRIRKNEGVEVYTTRKDTKDKMEIGVGFSDHEAKEAIVKEFEKLAVKLAKRNDLESVGVRYY